MGCVKGLNYQPKECNNPKVWAELVCEGRSFQKEYAWKQLVKDGPGKTFEECCQTLDKIILHYAAGAPNRYAIAAMELKCILLEEAHKRGIYRKE